MKKFKFDPHARRQMRKRRITESEVEESVSGSDSTGREGGIQFMVKLFGGEDEQRAGAISRCCRKKPTKVT
ncbi:MAG: DUF4258 domain-containing protein [Actinomycetota bacterium]